VKAPIRFLIRKDTEVWVAHGVSFPCVLTKHTMLKDMSIPYPVMDASDGPKVVGLAHEVHDLHPSQIMMLQALMAESTMFSKRGRLANCSFFSILNFGYHIFATDDEAFPFIVARMNDVDCIDNDWDVEDWGDGLVISRQSPGSMNFVEPSSFTPTVRKPAVRK